MLFLSSFGSNDRNTMILTDPSWPSHRVLTNTLLSSLPPHCCVSSDNDIGSHANTTTAAATPTPPTAATNGSTAANISTSGNMTTALDPVLSLKMKVIDCIIDPSLTVTDVYPNCLYLLAYLECRRPTIVLVGWFGIGKQCVEGS
jgi:hypothetical protein